MGLPVWSVGQVLTASDVNSYFVPVTAYKTADLSRATQTMSNDPDLAVAYAANAFYQFSGYLLYTADSGGDFQWTFSGLTGATLRYAAVRNNLSGGFAGAFANVGGDNVTAQGQGTATLMNVTFNGTLFTATSAGTMTLQWARNTSSSNAATLKAQSSLVLQRIG